jgi:hypothetical protein
LVTSFTASVSKAAPGGQGVDVVGAKYPQAVIEQSLQRGDCGARKAGFS